MEWTQAGKLTDADRKQLRSEARAVFDGQQVLKPRFAFEINAFKATCARESGDMLHLPIEGGSFEQPEKAMEIIVIIQEEYRREKKGAVKK
jgi:hypothetical protein